MRFMTMVKGKEDQGPPPPALMEAMGKLVEEAIKGGTMVEMGGLAPSAMGARVRLSGGKVSVIDGPYAEAKEVVGGFAILELGSQEEGHRGGQELHRASSQALAGLGRGERGPADLLVGVPAARASA